MSKLDIYTLAPRLYAYHISNFEYFQSGILSQNRRNFVLRNVWDLRWLVNCWIQDIDIWGPQAPNTDLKHSWLLNGFRVVILLSLTYLVPSSSLYTSEY
jgi:hypothetical protein